MQPAGHTQFYTTLTDATMKGCIRLSLYTLTLGSGLTDQSQKMTVAARAMAEKKALGHRS